MEGSGLGGVVYRDYIGVVEPKLTRKMENVAKAGLLPKKSIFTKQDSFLRVNGLFGCTTRETGLFKTQLANGIMGLADRTNTITSSPNFVDDLFASHKSKNKNFSLCLGTNGGYMTWGGYNVNKHIKGEPIQTISYTGNYKINVTAIGTGKPFKNNIPRNNMALLDSGTTYTYVNNDIWFKLKKQWNYWCNNKKNRMSKGLKRCNNRKILVDDYCATYIPKKHKSYENFFSQFPTLYITLEKKKPVIWFPKDYFLLKGVKSLITGNSRFCTSINLETSGNGYSTFGSSFFRHYDIYFNRTQKKISFVRSECEDQAKRSYPVRGISPLIASARILLGNFFSSLNGLFFLIFTSLMLFSSVLYYRRYYKNKSKIYDTDILRTKGIEKENRLSTAKKIVEENIEKDLNKPISHE